VVWHRGDEESSENGSRATGTPAGV